MGVHENQRGVTLVELTTAIAVFAVVGAALTTVAVSMLASSGYQSRIADAQLDVASGIALVQDDLRAAGYVMDNMNQSVFQSLTSGTTSDSIQFVGDVNSDNVSERITYTLSDGTLLRTQDVWNGVSDWTLGTAQPVAANVTAFTLQFYLVDPCSGAISTQTASQVLASGQTTFVSITLTGTATYKGQSVTRTLKSDVAERQQDVRPTCL